MVDFLNDDEFDYLLKKARADTASQRQPEAPTLIGRGQAPEPEDPDDPYLRFLEAIKNGQHPDYCTLVWDGDKFLIEFTIPLQKHPNEDIQVIRNRAHRYFRRYTQTEQKIVSFNLVCKDNKLYHALIRVRPEAAGVLKMGTTRLRDLARDPRL
jgi:hypothetical protein